MARSFGWNPWSIRPPAIKPVPDSCGLEGDASAALVPLDCFRIRKGQQRNSGRLQALVIEVIKRASRTK
jgi:hypothetical protein